MCPRSLIAAVIAVSTIWSAAHSQTSAGGQPITPPPTLPGIPPASPGIYSQQPPLGLPHNSGAATSPAQVAPPPNPGPVTGYGPGGMTPVPGAPQNPPYYGPR